MTGGHIHRTISSIAGAIVALAALVASPVAFAHHPRGGVAPQTFIEGFLSGIGHPVIGPDHLAFILALGLLAGLTRGSTLALPAAFVLASLAGVLVHLAGIDVPLAEPAVAASVVAVGLGIALAGRRLAPEAVWIGFAALAGVLHGYAFGEAVVGSEHGAIGAYLVGLAIVQFGLAALALFAGKLIDARLGARWRVPAGLAVSSLGAALIVLSVIQG